MSGILEQSAIMDISSQLDKFKTVEPNKTYNFRCNICGDSQDNEYKLRGYFFYSQKDDIYMFKCHNCGVTYSFQHYLKIYFNTEYKALRTNIFKSRGIRQFAPKVEKDFKIDDIFDSEYQEQLDSLISTTKQYNILQPLTSLSKNAPARQYMDSRGINIHQQAKLYYADNFQEFITSVIPASILGERHIPDDPRIIFPLTTIDDEIIGFQGRCIGSASDLRYSTIKIAESYPKMFGLNRIERDTDSPIIVVEGAMDSLFINNCIALNGGDINSLQDIINGENIDKSRFIIVLDNEPRSKDTKHRTQKAIDAGYKVVIWERINPEFKDINDMILGGVFDSNGILNNTNTLKRYILSNNYSGTMATLKLKHWSKF